MIVPGGRGIVDIISSTYDKIRDSSSNNIKDKAVSDMVKQVNEKVARHLSETLDLCKADKKYRSKIEVKGFFLFTGFDDKNYLHSSGVILSPFTVKKMIFERDKDFYHHELFESIEIG